MCCLTEQRPHKPVLFRAARLCLLLLALYALSGHSGAITKHPSSHTSSVRPTDSAVSHNEISEGSAPAERAVQEGELLLADWTEDSSRGAIKKFAEARSICQSAADAPGEIRALSLAGDVHLSLSEYSQALDSYAEALKLSRLSGNRWAEAKALSDISVIYAYLGEVKKAISYSERAHRMSRDAGDRLGEAWALNNLGEAYYFAGDMQKARRSFEEAFSLWRDEDWRGRSQTLLNMGYVHFDVREMEKASDNYSQALSIFRAANYRRGEALALTAIGGLDSYLGRRQSALDHHNRAVTLFHTMGDRNGEAVALNGLGYVYRELGEYQKALDCYARARQFFSVLGNREYEDFTTIRVGNSYQGMGDNQKAIECYRQSLRRSARYSQTKANALNFIGMAYDSMGETRKSLDHYRQALGLYKAVEDKMGEASVLGNIGNAYHAVGKDARALDYYRQALTRSRAARDSSGEMNSLFQIAKVLRDRGELAAARAEIEAALAVVESLRHELSSRNLRDSYSASVQQYYELYIDLLMQLHRQRPGDGLAGLALQVSEMARARSLLDTLRDVREDIRRGAEPGASSRAHELSLALGVLFERETRLLSGRHTPEQVAALAGEIQALKREYDEVESEIRAQSPRYAALTRPPSLTLREIQQQVLEDDTLLLEYAMGDQRSYLWAVTKDEMTAYELPGRKEIEDAARSVYELLTARRRQPGEAAAQYSERVARADEEYWRQASALSNLLLEPVADRLGAKRLLLVLDGALQYIPFGALPAPTRGAAVGADAAVPLIALQEIINLPSASIQAGLRQERARREDVPGTVAVFADPVFEEDDPRLRQTAGASFVQASAQGSPEPDAGAGALPGGRSFPRLLYSRDEAKAIVGAAPSGTTLQALDFTANRATALSPRLNQYRIIHFATHGVIDSQHPELTYLVLSQVNERGQKQDGMLLLGDIYNLNLPAEMVVLSACDTALGKDVRGEGLVGLTRGFMYAGASSVVASLWAIDDEATAELMKVFYSRMLIDGMPRAAALREAQLSLWKQKRWRAPYYWAAFVLQGNHRPAAGDGLKGAGDSAVAGWATASVFLLLCGLYGVQRQRDRGMLKRG